MKHKKATSRTHLGQQGFTAVWALVVILVIAAVIVVGYGVFHKKAPVGKVAKAPNRPGIITNEEFSNTVSDNGAAIKPGSSFSKNDQKIYAVATLKNAKVGTTVSYIRYYNGVNVGAGSVKISKEGTKNVGFLFTTKAGKQRHAGTYKVKLYTDNKAEVSSSYTVK